nr:hypothetical protein [uncultured Draconibacterium sp.]
MKYYNTINIQGKEIRYNYDKEGRAVPMSGDILRLVGIPELIDGIDELYGFMENYDSEGLLKWASYRTDLRCPFVKNQLYRYFLIDMGIRIHCANQQDTKNDEWLSGVHWIQTLLDDFTTEKTIQREMEKEGFNIQLIEA